jgi:hypothetical protein
MVKYRHLKQREQGRQMGSALCPGRYVRNTKTEVLAVEATVRKVVDGKLLNQIVDLPESFQNTLVEIIVTPFVIKKAVKKITRAALIAKLRGSHTESLTGAIHTNQNISLDEYQMERRQKYDSPT